MQRGNGDKGGCPNILRDGSAAKAQAEADWQRGKDDAAANRSAKRADVANATYLLGRKMHELEVAGRLPKPRKRAARVPVKSEPRLAAVTSATRDAS